jgi:pimeloyl-ACP methyl ester carboxylesterase
MRRFYVDTPEGQVHGVDAGSGPVLLLLHHTPRSWTFWRPLIPMLTEHHRVIAPDTLGFGASDPAPAGFTAADLAANAVHVLDALGVERAHVFGAMTGTRTAVDIAVSSPERVEKLVLMALPYFESGEARDARLRQSQQEHMGAPEPDGSHIVKLWRYVLDNLAATDADSSHAPGVYARTDELSSPIAELTPAQLDYLNDWIVDTVRAGDMWRRAAKAVYSEDPVPKLRSIAAPTLVIGLTGKGFPPFIQAVNTRRAQAEIAGSAYAEIDAPDADSRVIASHAGDVAALVLPFLAAQ